MSKTEIVLFLLLLLFVPYTFPAELPGKQWHELIQEVADNPSREAALTEQESSWRIFAESPFAKGLRQFTPETADWLEMGMCSHLGSGDVFDPVWSLKCGIIYSEYLEKEKFGDYCNTRKVAEMRYNGGYWIVWELRTAQSTEIDDAADHCGTELYNGRKRSFRSCTENYFYPIKISERQKKYIELGGRQCSA